MVHRVYLTPGMATGMASSPCGSCSCRSPTRACAGQNLYRAQVRVVAGARATAEAVGGGTDDILPAKASYLAGEPKPDANLKFNPVKARYLLVQGPARIAELEVYGSADQAAFEKKDAVVVAPNAPELLRIAAEDLRYYMGELTAGRFRSSRPRRKRISGNPLPHRGLEAAGQDR